MIATKTGEEANWRSVAASATTLTSQNLVIVANPLLVAAVAGRMGGDALYVMALFRPLSLVVSGVIVGLGSTMQVLSARAQGGQAGLIRRYHKKLTVAGVATALVLLLIVLLLMPTVDGLLRASPASAQRLETLVIAFLVVLPLSVAAELPSAALRGVGDARASTALSVLYLFINVIVVAVFGIGTRAGLFAVPLGTAAASALEFAAGYVLLRRRGLCSPSAAPPRTAPIWSAVMRVGLPSTASLLLVFIYNLLLLHVAAPLGSAVVTALGLVVLVETAAMAPAFGYAATMGTLLNRLLATGKVDRARKAFHVGLAQLIACYSGMAVVMVAVGAPLVHGLTDDPAVAHAASGALAVMGPAFCATGVVLGVLGILYQLGWGGIVLLLNVCYFSAVLGVAAWLVTTTGKPGSLYWTIALAAAASLCIGLPIAYRLTRRALRATATSWEPA